MKTSKECKKAVNRISAFEGNLQKDLEDFESQRKRKMRSLREKKLNFLQKASTLPKLYVSLPKQTEEMINSGSAFTKRLSLDDRHDSALGELYDRLATKKRLSVPTLTTCQATQELLLKKPGGERNEVNIKKLQPVLSDAGTIFPSNLPLARRRGSEILQREKTRALNRQHSLPEKPIIIEIDHGDEAGNEDQYGSNPEVVPFKNSLKVPAPFASLGTQLPRSPTAFCSSESARPAKECLITRLPAFQPPSCCDVEPRTEPRAERCVCETRKRGTKAKIDECG